MKIVINSALLKTVAECENYEGKIQNEIDSANLSIQVSEKNTNDSTENTGEYQEELADLEEEIGLTQPFYEALPEKSDAKKDQQIRLMDLNKRKVVLLDRLKEDDLQKVLNKQVRLGKIKASIEVLTDTLAQIVARKAELTTVS